MGNEMTSERIVWSHDNETFNCDGLGELLDIMSGSEELCAGRIVYFGETVEPRRVWVDAASVLEDIANRAYDDGGEHAEDFPDVAPEAAAELDAFLSEWQQKHCVPTWWGVRNVKEYTLTAEDVADYVDQGEALKETP